MKRFLTLLCLVCFVQLSFAANEAVIPLTEEPAEHFVGPIDTSMDLPVVASTSVGEDKVMHCFLIDACGQGAQWCDEGHHPPLGDYLEDLMDHFC